MAEHLDPATHSLGELLENAQYEDAFSKFCMISKAAAYKQHPMPTNGDSLLLNTTHNARPDAKNHGRTGDVVLLSTNKNGQTQFTAAQARLFTSPDYPAPQGQPNALQFAKVSAPQARTQELCETLGKEGADMQAMLTTIPQGEQTGEAASALASINQPFKAEGGSDTYAIVDSADTPDLNEALEAWICLHKLNPTAITNPSR